MYNKVALQRIIDKHQDVLRKAGLPLKVDNFVRYINANYVHDPEAKRVIDIIFADPLQGS